MHCGHEYWYPPQWCYVLPAARQGSPGGVAAVVDRVQAVVQPLAMVASSSLYPPCHEEGLATSSMEMVQQLASIVCWQYIYLCVAVQPDLPQADSAAWIGHSFTTGDSE